MLRQVSTLVPLFRTLAPSSELHAYHEEEVCARAETANVVRHATRSLNGLLAELINVVNAKYGHLVLDSLSDFAYVSLCSFGGALYASMALLRGSVKCQVMKLSRFATITTELFIVTNVGWMFIDFESTGVPMLSQSCIRY